jgi:anti-sigma regulatory factor (Ser/Thr protein kinase)
MSAQQLPVSVAWHPVRERARSGGSPLGELMFPARPESAGLARTLLGPLAALWGVPVEVAERAELPVSEVITNAIRHAARFPGDTLALAFIRTDCRFRIEVHDPSPLLPKRRDADPLAETGRGMWLVEEFSDENGAYLTPDGKAVWCEFVAWPTPEETAS